ncbi:CGNR zinc finger domain-containing protein [Jatrophihabitans sp. YIM 134969]
MDTARVADHPALDFVGTVAERNSTRHEHLRTPVDLDDWLVRAGVVDRHPQADDDDLIRALEVREALYALLVAASDSRPLPRAALAAVNRAAANPPVTARLAPDGTLTRTGDVTAALSTVARSALDLVGGDDLARLRWCDDTACTHPFLDRSRAGRRRWCGMAGCGDRAKARAYRARRRE